ncbi:MAG TPA: amidohydrolase family protein [Thermoanaerobaculia bacterium]
MKPLRAFACAVLISLSSAAFASDVDDARSLFEKNLAAIQHRDRAAYLACYLDSPQLVRTSPDGPALGFTDFEKQAGAKWPDTLEAADLQLVPVREGIVYGTYRYRVRYGGDEHAGISERLFVKTPKGWKIAVTSAFEAPPGTPPPPRAFMGATLLDGNGGPPVKDAVVLVRGGKIDCAGTRAACPVPPGVERTDLTGAFLTPGLVDAHVHFAQTGWADGRPDAFDVRSKHPYEDVQRDLRSHPERFFRSYVCSGVTSVFDVGGFAWSLDLPVRAENDTLAPRVRAAGPLLSTIDFWLNLPGERQFIFLKDAEAARTAVAYLASRGAPAVKVWYVVTPDRPVDASEAAVFAAGAEAKKRSLPLIVHATGLAEAKVALRAGASLLVHGVSDKPVDDEFLDLLKKSGAIYNPTLVVIGGYVALAKAAAAGTALAFDDPNGCVDPATRARLAATPEIEAASVASKVHDREVRTAERNAVGLANLRRVRDAGIPIAMGTDAGNPGTLHGPSVYAEMEAMQAAGMTPMEVLVAATKGGSRALSREKDIGTVEKGKNADLVVFTKDPTADITNARSVKAVVRGGVYRTEEELRAIVAAEGEPAQ